MSPSQPLQAVSLMTWVSQSSSWPLTRIRTSNCKVVYKCTVGGSTCHGLPKGEEKEGKERHEAVEGKSQ